MTEQPGMVVLYSKTDGRVPIAKVPGPDQEPASKLHAHNPNPRRRQDLPTMRVPSKVSNLFVAGRAGPEDTQNQAIAKMLADHPELYDEAVQPKRSIAKSAAILAKGAEILETLARVKVAKGQAKTMAEAVSLVVAERPELYDALVKVGR